MGRTWQIPLVLKRSLNKRLGRLSRLVVRSLMIAVALACATLLTTTGDSATRSAQAQSQGSIKMGELATLTGPFAQLGDDGLRGVQTALDEFGGQVAGKKIVVSKESSDATPNVARDAARKLIEQDGVDFMIGPLSGDEGIAVKDYAKSQPRKVFLNGSSAAQDTTLFDPAPNFYRFSTDGVQWMAGLGDYVYRSRHYRKVVTLGEDYSFPYSQVGGFMTEFCRAGGHVTKKLWVPLGAKDFSSVISSIPRNIDAIYVALGGADGLNFLKQYVQFGGKAPLIGGSITVDQTMLNTKGDLYSHVIGVPAAGPIADDNTSPQWKKFVAEYAKQPGALHSPSLFAHAYYVNTKAALLALQAVHGDLSNGESAFKTALGKLHYLSPTGMVWVDSNRNGVADQYLTVVTKQPDGRLYNKLIRVIPHVNQTLGVKPAEFVKRGKLSRDNPSCP